jgi:hypothetical protein
MKKRIILVTLALTALLPLAGCVAPYPYYGYYGRGYYGGGYGDADYGYNRGGTYGDRRYAPYADYNYGYDD